MSSLPLPLPSLLLHSLYKSGDKEFGPLSNGILPFSPKQNEYVTSALFVTSRSIKAKRLDWELSYGLRPKRSARIQKFSFSWKDFLWTITKEAALALDHLLIPQVTPTGVTDVHSLLACTMVIDPLTKRIKSGGSYERAACRRAITAYVSKESLPNALYLQTLRILVSLAIHVMFKFVIFINVSQSICSIRINTPIKPHTHAYTV